MHATVPSCDARALAEEEEVSIKDVVHEIVAAMEFKGKVVVSGRQPRCCCRAHTRGGDVLS